MQDAGLQETLEAQRAELTFLAPSIMQATPTRVDVIKLLDECQQAVSTGDWTAVMRSARPLGNVVMAHDATRSDRDYHISLHPLDFVAFDFSGVIEFEIGTLAAAKSSAGDRGVLRTGRGSTGG